MLGWITNYSQFIFLDLHCWAFCISGASHFLDCYDFIYILLQPWVAIYTKVFIKFLLGEALLWVAMMRLVVQKRHQHFYHCVIYCFTDWPHSGNILAADGVFCFLSIHTVVPVGSGALVGNFKGKAVVSKLEKAYCQSPV